MSEFIRFGDPALFEIAARWSDDAEPRERRPREGGWSTGDLQLTVGHHVLTARRHNGSENSYIAWYLFPLLDWLLSHWTSMLHEEAYAWPEKTGAPAASAVFAALGQYIASSDEIERKTYRDVQAWWMRHALRAADPSALYPDVCLRRLGDDIEISWAGRQPVHAPEGFALTSSPGFATFAVAVVATPLWRFMEWALRTAHVETAADRSALETLKRRFNGLKQTPLSELELAHLRTGVQALFRQAKQAVGLQGSSVRVQGIPAIETLDHAVLMFGGLSPSIGSQDAGQLLRFLDQHRHGEETAALMALVDDRRSNLAVAPYHEGYELGEDVRDELGIPAAERDVNVRRCLRDLGITVEEVTLESDSVRGVAIAGPGYSPAILVNMTSRFNKTWEGRSFTLAHELCHILFDRTRAKGLSHVSGPWTSLRTEQRANAFAAMFIASRSAVRAVFREYGVEGTKLAAQALQLSHSAFIEHLYNLGLIDDGVREQLRTSESTRPPPQELSPIDPRPGATGKT
jgi:hypothetical protein